MPRTDLTTNYVYRYDLKKVSSSDYSRGLLWPKHGIRMDRGSIVPFDTPQLKSVWLLHHHHLFKID